MHSGQLNAYINDVSMSQAAAAVISAEAARGAHIPGRPTQVSQANATKAQIAGGGAHQSSGQFMRRMDAVIGMGAMSRGQKAAAVRARIVRQSSNTQGKGKGAQGKNVLGRNLARKAYSGKEDPAGPGGLAPRSPMYVQVNADVLRRKHKRKQSWREPPCSAGRRQCYAVGRPPGNFGCNHRRHRIPFAGRYSQPKRRFFRCRSKPPYVRARASRYTGTVLTGRKPGGQLGSSG